MPQSRKEQNNVLPSLNSSGTTTTTMQYDRAEMLEYLMLPEHLLKLYPTFELFQKDLHAQRARDRGEFTA